MAGASCPRRARRGRIEVRRAVRVMTAVLLAAAVLQCSCAKRGPRKEARLLMGTTVEITVAGENPALAQAATAKAFREIERVEAVFSTYREDSEVSRINLRAGEQVLVSGGTVALLKNGRIYGQLTGGCFDVTVRPLLVAWGFRDGEPHRPAQDDIDHALGLVGWDKVILTDEPPGVRLSEPGMGIDLGGLAKGYAVDRAAAVLKQEGVRSALVNAGGDLFAFGPGPGGDIWRIGIEHPRQEGKLVVTVEVRDSAVTTSGDYRSYFMADGMRYSHIMDPRTGRPALRAASATVVAPSAAQADALATALVVMGAEEGLALVEGLEGVEAMVVEESGDGIAIRKSTGMRDLARSR